MTVKTRLQGDALTLGYDKKNRGGESHRRDPRR
ncbi:Uncharacterised protein [Pantoea agglomerans]|uniref:Uncharacterized protein n=1 Tax=Enterobacter agglomerans TaxID=549 RepID=A0A379ALQ3_ENTAG|nr:Uncharacterised protein [Pantoea agglomerans]